MATTYTAPNKLVGFADSVNATGRFGRSAFTLFVDFAKVGAPAATGLVEMDIVDGIGALPENCVVRTVAAQVVKPITVLSEDGISALPITLKAGSTTLASMTLEDVNGPELGAEWTDVSLSNGSTGVAGAKKNLSLTIGEVLDNKADEPAATAITGGVLMLVFFVDYIPEVDELKALFNTVNEISDGGNTATEITDFGLGY
jgi:hypothetical protein